MLSSRPRYPNSLKDNWLKNKVPLQLLRSDLYLTPNKRHSHVEKINVVFFVLFSVKKSIINFKLDSVLLSNRVTLIQL